jgi:cytoskeletal protein RodZ
MRMPPSSVSILDGTPDGAAFGEFLRQARERRGLTLQQISSETKIPWRHLDALEHGHLNAVPGGTYRRGEIRAYAEVVGLDKAIALERLDRALQASTTPAPQRRPSSAAPSRGWSLLLVALIAVAAMWTITWNRGAAKPSTATRRNEPLPVVRTINTWNLTSLPFVRPDAPMTGEIAASAAADVSTPSSQLDASLTITSQPPGARVTVDGIAWGVTPVTVRHLSPGDRRVRVSLPDFAAVERSVRMPDDRSATSLHVVLTATPQR